MPWMFGIMTAIVCVAHETRAMSSPSAFGITSATFHVCAGTATCTVRDRHGHAHRCSRPAAADAACDDIYLVAGASQVAQVNLERRPRTLIVIGRLSDHVRHQERRLIDRDRRSLSRSAFGTI